MTATNQAQLAEETKAFIAEHTAEYELSTVATEKAWLAGMVAGAIELYTRRYPETATADLFGEETE